MPAKGKTVHALEEKLEFVAAKFSQPREFGTVLAAGNQSALAAQLKMKPQSLFTACLQGRLSVPKIKSLSEFCGFRLDDPRWHDWDVDDKYRCVNEYDKYPGRDSVDGFAEMVLEALAPKRARLQLDSYDSFDDNVLSFEIDGSGQDTDLRGPLPLILRVVADIGWPHRTVRFGFRKVQVKLYRITGQNGVFQDFLEGSKLFFKNAQIECNLSAHKPIWTLSAREDVLHGTFTSESAVAYLRDASREDTFRADLVVNVHSPDFLFVHSSEEIAPETLKIAEALLRTRVRGTAAPKNGWKILATHNIKITVNGEK